MQVEKGEGKKLKKKKMGALLPAAKNRLGTMGKLSVISVHSEPLRLKQCSTQLGQNTNFLRLLNK